MTSLVVDASAVGAYLPPDEDSDLLPGLTEALMDWRLVVPRALRAEADSLSGSDAWDLVMHMAVAHNLTIYDAGYLALAKRCELPLATRDARLSAGARAEKVILFGT